MILLVGHWLGGSGGLILAFLPAVIMKAGTYWYSDKIVLNAYRAAQLLSLAPAYIDSGTTDFVSRG